MVVVVNHDEVGVGDNRAQLLTRVSVDDRLSLDDMLVRVVKGNDIPGL